MPAVGSHYLEHYFCLQPMLNYYEILGIGEKSSVKTISSTGRSLLEQTHPYVVGKGDSGQRFKQVYEAVALLIEDDLRREYNYTLTYAINGGDVSGAEVPAGLVRDRIKLAKIEAEQLSKDYLLFYNTLP